MGTGEEADRVRWSRVIGITTVGALFVGAALYVEKRYPEEEVWQSVLSGIGVTVGLLGLATILGPRLVRRVEEVAVHAAEQVEARVEDRLSARLDNLQDLVSDRATEQTKQQDDAIAKLDEDVSACSVAKALHVANSVNAIRDGRITVPAGTGTDHLRLRFGWGSWGYSGESSEREPVLELTASEVSIVWSFDIAPDAVVVELINQLQASGAWADTNQFDFALAIRHLRRALNDAIDSRRHKSGHQHLKGQLIERFDDNLMITTVGIEAPKHDYICPRSEIDLTLGFHRPDLHPERPERPDFATEATWEKVTEKAARQLVNSVPGASFPHAVWRAWGGAMEPFPEPGTELPPIT